MSVRGSINRGGFPPSPNTLLTPYCLTAQGASQHLHLAYVILDSGRWSFCAFLGSPTTRTFLCPIPDKSQRYFAISSRIWISQKGYPVIPSQFIKRAVWELRVVQTWGGRLRRICVIRPTFYSCIAHLTFLSDEDFVLAHMPSYLLPLSLFSVRSSFVRRTFSKQERNASNLKSDKATLLI